MVDTKTVEVLVKRNEKNIPTYFAGCEGDYWRDKEAPSLAVDAAWEGSNVEGVESLDVKPDGEWHSVELFETRTGWYARPSGSSGVGLSGDAPGEAVNKLAGHDWVVEPATTAGELETQIMEIVHTPVEESYSGGLLFWLINPDALGWSPSHETVCDVVDSLVDSDEYGIGVSNGKYVSR